MIAIPMRLAIVTSLFIASLPLVAQDPPSMTHGPMLGAPAADAMTVWCRTSEPTPWSVHYGREPGDLRHIATAPTTQWDHDCTGSLRLHELTAQTRYYYQVYIQELPQGSLRSFRTLPSAAEVRDPHFNPRGLFNFSFEIGSCANQNPQHGIGHELPLYRTMNERIADEVDFAIMNGDWLYEELRETPPSAWQAKHGLNEATTPDVVKQMPSIVGVWENYKLYLCAAYHSVNGISVCQAILRLTITS